MMAYSEDDIARAIEYALGTLDADERAQVEAMMSVDKDFTAMVRAWDYKLGVLNEMVGSIEPSPELWERIKSVTGISQPQEPVVLPEITVPVPELAPEPLATTAAEMDDSTAKVIRLSAQVRRWRSVASFTTAIAAALVAMIAIGAYQPGLLPDAIRPKPRTQVVEVKPPPAPAQPSAQSPQYVAVLQKDGGSPAFILTVDGATKNFTVRRVAAQPEPGRSYELWIVSDKLQRPRSLGVIGADDFTARPVLAAYAPEIVDQATYAVTVEPEGGSPTGVATGPIVFTGKLVETVPPAASAASKPN
jgi:anti-sigma-K factor RskA